jgi:CubicO group peptidase (beta-lactamase class C family)
VRDIVSSFKRPAQSNRMNSREFAEQEDVPAFMKPSAMWPFGSPAAFGAPGAGGALGFADPQTGIGYAYVTNRMGAHLTGDPREVALREAVTSCVRGTAR